MLPQWNIKDPGHSAKSAGGKFQLNRHTFLTQRSRSGLTMPLSRHSVGKLFGKEFTRNLSGTIGPQSSQLAELLWTDPGINSGISARELISTSKQRKTEAQAGNEWSNILPKFSPARGKKTPHQIRQIKLLDYAGPASRSSLLLMSAFPVR